MSKSFTMAALAEQVSGKLVGDGTALITRLVHPADILGANDLPLLMDKKLLPLVEGKDIGMAVLSPDTAHLATGMKSSIVVDRPRLAIAKLTSLFEEVVAVATGIHPSAVVEKGAVIGADVAIGPFVYVGAGAVLGDGVRLHPQSYVGAGAKIGNNSVLMAGVKVGAGCVVGDRAIVHFNASIGADGFSFVTPQVGSVEAAKASGGVSVTSQNRALIRIASLAPVIIGDDVEIGANTSIDRGTIAPTRIGNGTKIDNQVQVGHNVRIGENCMICGRVGIAGSVEIGDRVVLGGAVGIADHVKIGDDSMAMAMSGIAGNVLPRTIVGGIPAAPRDKMMENHLNLNRLKGYFAKVTDLMTRVSVLEAASKKD